MEDAIKKIRNVAHHNKWIGFAEDQVFAVLCIVKPIEEAVAGGESVIASQTIHLLLCGRLRSLRRLAEVSPSVVDVQHDIRNLRECQYPFEVSALRKWKPKG